MTLQPILAAVESLLAALDRATGNTVSSSEPVEFEDLTADIDVAKYLLDANRPGLLETWSLDLESQAGRLYLVLRRRQVLKNCAK